MTGRKTGQVLRDIRPRLSAVPGHTHRAVVSAGVVHAGLLGRLRQRDNCRPLRNSIVPGNVDLATLKPHGYDIVALFVRGEIGADRFPRITTIGAAEDAICRREQHTRVGWRQHQWRVPMEAIRFARRRIRHVLRGRPNRFRLTRHLVATRHVPVLRLSINDARVAEIGNGNESITTLNLEPVVIEYASAHARRAGTTPVIIVLHTAAHVERHFHVERNVIKQSDRQIRNERPGAVHIVGDRQPSVIANQHMVGVLRINPDRVHVVVRDQRGVCFKRASAIHRQMETHTRHVNAIGVYRIDTHLTEVHRTRIGRTRFAPRHAPVV